MVKRVITHVYCDRCGIEHDGWAQGIYNLRATTVNLSTVVDWKDLCHGCSAYITDTIEGWIIG